MVDLKQVNLATEYRPQKFADVVGQDMAVRVLKKIAHSDGIAARAIFLKGAWGSGKTTLARIFGKAMNCSSFKKDDDVCCECDMCKEVMSKTSQLYYEYDSSSAGNVEQIRNLSNLLSISPNGRRVIVWDEIQNASKAALNALLKIVEEGVKDTVFVFCSTEDILSTLKSRSINLEIYTIPFDLIKKRVKEIMDIRGITMTDEQLNILALKSGGHMRDALSILQLFEMCGESALSSSYLLVKDYLISCLTASRRNESLDILTKILMFNIVDIKNSIESFIKNVYSDSNNAILKTGLINSIFSFFYNPTVQQAMKSEIGMEITLKSFFYKTKRNE